jgi:hypothetical protein
VTETGPPISWENGAAAANQASARVRWLAGNQIERYQITPGKNPASAAPRRKRSA